MGIKRRTATSALFRTGTVLLLGTALVALPGCQQGNTDSDDPQATEAATPRAHEGAAVAIADDRIYWGQDETLWAADLNEDGSLDIPQRLGRFDEDIRMLAAHEDGLAITTDDAVYALGSDDRPADAEELTDAHRPNGLWVVDDAALYVDDGDLYAVTLDGDDRSRIARDVEDFVVADGMVYLLNNDNEVHRCTLGGEGDEELAETDADEALLLADGDDVYLAADELLVHRGEDEGGSFENVGLAHGIEDPSRVVLHDGAIIYEGTDDEAYRHEDGGEDEELDHGIFRGKPYGCVHGDFLYYTISGDDATVVDLKTMEYEEYDADESSSGDAETGSSSVGAGDGDTRADAPAASFDIGRNMKISEGSDIDVLTTDYIYLPLDRCGESSSPWTVEQRDSTTLEFFCTEAHVSEDYDGRVFTLEAWEWGDNGYAEYPQWVLAGQDEEMKYVVVLPTDVRYNDRDAGQRELYGRMLEYAQSLDMNTNPEGNPLQTH